MKREQYDPSQPAEKDERFPSGPWTGFWLQPPLSGRQWMRDFWLHFFEGKVEGAGSDWVGEFIFRGTYELASGKCELIKTYLESHEVEYTGQNEGDGKWLWGVWQLRSGYDRGGFHMWPKGQADPTQQRLAEEVDVPVEQEAPVLVENA